MIIFFLGVDTAGKDTVMHALAKEFNYSVYMSPRSPICNIVYDLIYKRTKGIKQEYVDLIENFLNMGALFVYVYAEPEILLQRAKARKEKHVTDLETFKVHMRVYDKVFKEVKKLSPNRFVRINNSGDLNQTVKKLRKFIENA